MGAQRSIFLGISPRADKPPHFCFRTVTIFVKSPLGCTMFDASLRLKLCLLLLSTCISSALADYYIDDTNTTLTYSSGPKAAWAPYAVGGVTLELLLPNGTYQDIDAFACWNHTYRYAACFDTDTCLLTIPFTGSGITYFVFQSGPVGINATITIDGQNPVTTVLNAPAGPAYEVPNVTMFNVQGLSSGPHSAQILINDLQGSYSGMMFDYAYVNETTVGSSSTASTSSTSTPSTTTAPGSSSSKHTNTAAIVGAIVAAVAVIIVIAFAVLYFRRRKRRQRGGSEIDLVSEPKMTPYNSYSAYDPLNGGTSPTGRTIPDTATNLSTTSVLSPNRRFDFREGIPARPPATSSGSSGSYSRDRKGRLALSNDPDGAIPPAPISFVERSTTSSNQPAPSPPTPSPPAPSEPTTSPQTTRRDLSPALTDEQADFINSLYTNNVPAAAIARVMERMLADRGSAQPDWENESRLSRAFTITAPPAYEYEE
ncbi:hypothetical protein BJ138DRAFT_1123819 [Hygrophoropsis aurantiaca]|uniref:Uncharacterized protein n=1 Tax=Hygrophoropsis aurantiaca TaxID=72124 RepID=A0ACB8AM20_9AGAM|nr:hypothetical protein BJ138DRAFT_1123819 [Hygrophoropsis aurantiaca]